MGRALIVQLARLGDLLQTLPAITAITSADSSLSLDLLCPAPLSPIGRMLPGITRVLEWDGPAWRQRGQDAGTGLHQEHLNDAERRISELSSHRYDRAYVLNQHPRALLAGALLAREMKGPRLHGPLSEQPTPWASYVRDVAANRRGCRVHLADAFCGLCGVYPPGTPGILRRSPYPLTPDLESIGKQGGPWIGLIVGAGADERLVPIEVWQRWILQFMAAAPAGRVVLVGQECERARSIQDLLPSSSLGRLWDATGRTSLPELAEILGRCHIVIGTDTGPLHLAAAVGARVIGWYFARARVHETGPYGTDHLVWQAHQAEDGAVSGPFGVQPASWPIQETIDAVLTGRMQGLEGWSVWMGQCDRWGAYYSEGGRQPAPPREREDLWQELQPLRG
ncbi:MAG: glycosyltransferase family 9 protein [Nitrospira sp.]|nr:glycosyltransferase family 9 protein [Nitrospira sp.]